MLKKNIFGYRYDETTGKYKIHDEEAKMIRTVFDLSSNYTLNTEEIVNLFNGTKTIVEVIADRIYYISEIAQQSQKNFGKEFDNISVEQILIENNNVQELIIDPIVKIKDKINKSDSSNKIFMLKNIDNVLMLIRKQDEINNKYGDFTQFNKENYQNINQENFDIT